MQIDRSICYACCVCEGQWNTAGVCTSEHHQCSLLRTQVSRHTQSYLMPHMYPSIQKESCDTFDVSKHICIFLALVSLVQPGTTHTYAGPGQ